MHAEANRYYCDLGSAPDRLVSIITGKKIPGEKLFAKQK